MTGRQIRSIRDQLDIDPFAFAAVLGVHVSTVYRWEGKWKGGRGENVSASIDMIQRQVLEAIDAYFKRCDPIAPRELGVKITNGLVRGGNLFAL